MTRTLPASLLLLLALAGCATPAAAPPPPAPAPAAAAPWGVAHTANQQAFLDRLMAIDADLVDSPDLVIGRGANTCTELDKPEDVKVQDTVSRFSAAGTVTPDQARKILDAAAATICKDR